MKKCLLLYWRSKICVQYLIFSADKFEKIKLEPDSLIIQRNDPAHVLECPVIFGDE